MAPKTYGDNDHGDDDDEREVAYHESSDEDFNPDAAPADDDDDAATSSDDDAPLPRGKRKAAADADLDSGDEVTIEAARRKRAKRSKGARDDGHALSSDDGEAGLIKTRAQRAVEHKERRPLARTDGATVDVDALWAQMVSAPLRAVPAAPPTASAEAPQPAPAVAHAPADAPVDEELLTVTKTFVFAGQDTTEEKQIPRSALGTYTADGWRPTTKTSPAADADADADAAPKPPAAAADTHLHRPLRRPSRFDPNPTGYVRALPPEHQLSFPRKTLLPPAPAPAHDAHTKHAKATKLNVVDKSRMDWSGFVRKEGIADELHEHGKSKENYMARQAFLAGVDARREDEGRKGRVANATALT